MERRVEFCCKRPRRCINIVLAAFTTNVFQRRRLGVHGRPRRVHEAEVCNFPAPRFNARFGVQDGAQGKKEGQE